MECEHEPDCNGGFTFWSLSRSISCRIMPFCARRKAASLDAAEASGALRSVAKRHTHAWIDATSVRGFLTPPPARCGCVAMSVARSGGAQSAPGERRQPPSPKHPVPSIWPPFCPMVFDHIPLLMVFDHIPLLILSRTRHSCATNCSSGICKCLPRGTCRTCEGTGPPSMLRRSRCQGRGMEVAKVF